MRRQQFREKDPALKAKLKTEINATVKIINETVDIHRNNVTETKLSSDIEYNSDMFKNIKRVTNTCNNPIPPLVRKDGLIISNAKDKANLVADHFEKFHRQNEKLGHITNDLEVNTVVTSF